MLKIKYLTIELNTHSGAPEAILRTLVVLEPSLAKYLVDCVNRVENKAKGAD